MRKWGSAKKLQTAKVAEAVEDISTDPDPAANVDQKVLNRIQKCLALAEDRNATEAEAQAAVRMSSRLMQQHNLSRADLIAAQAASKAPSTITGETAVFITSPRADKNARMETWAFDIATAMCTMFDCKSYTTRGFVKTHYEWKFYGIASNAAAAALGFEVAHNITQDWSLRLKRGNKNSYRLGVAYGLRKLAQKEKEDLKQAARQQTEDSLAQRVNEEEQARQREIDRLAEHAGLSDVSEDQDGTEIVPQQPRIKVQDDDEIPIEQTSDSYNDDSCDDSVSDDSIYGGSGDSSDSEAGELIADFDADEELPVDLELDLKDDLHRHMPRKNDQSASRSPSPTLPPVPPAHDASLQRKADKQSGPLPRDVGALIQIGECAMNLADQYLKHKNVELKTGKKRRYNIVDQGAFEKGKDDSKKIDVKRKRIKGPEAKEVSIKKEEDK